MIHTEKIHCPYCQGNNLQKKGENISGQQRWRCQKCKKYFQMEYRYNARKQEVKEKTIVMGLYGSSVRDIGRILKINKNTVAAVLKKRHC